MNHPVAERASNPRTAPPARDIQNIGWRLLRTGAAGWAGVPWAVAVRVSCGVRLVNGVVVKFPPGIFVPGAGYPLAVVSVPVMRAIGVQLAQLGHGLLHHLASLAHGPYQPPVRMRLAILPPHRMPQVQPPPLLAPLRSQPSRQTRKGQGRHYIPISRNPAEKFRLEPKQANAKKSRPRATVEVRLAGRAEHECQPRAVSRGLTVSYPD